MIQKQKTFLNASIAFLMFAIGIAIVVASAFYVSSFVAVIGLGMVYWGAILLYVAPSKHVPLTLLNASADSNMSNIEHVLSELNLTEKGIYLPPKNLKNIEGSLLFVPGTSQSPWSAQEEIAEKLVPSDKTGLFLTPSGFSLSRLFEQELGTSFTKTDIAQLRTMLPKLLVEKLEIADKVDVQTQDNIIIVKMVASIFNQVCLQTNDYPKTHEQLGCILSSALACAFAKSSGKPVTIKQENVNVQTKTTRIEYQIEEA
jgi:hypothetical protein